VKAGLFRPITLYPFPREALRRAAAGRRLLVGELSNGQFRDDFAPQLGVDADTVPLAHRMGGVVISVEEVVNKAFAR
jgi:pyruvate/2-oxoacid:ferredoxin oxidoreductase alpha subunit